VTQDRLRRAERAIRPYLAAALLVGVTVAVAQTLSAVTWVPHISVLFLACVLGAAVPWGVGPSLLALVLAILASAYYFFPPLNDFRIASPQDVVDLGAFAAVGVLLSHLTHRIRRQAAEAGAREERIADLYAFSDRVAGVVDRGALCRAIIDGLDRAVAAPMALILPSAPGADLEVHGRAEAENPGPAVLAEAKRMIAGRATDPATIEEGEARWRLKPLTGGGPVVAVLAVRNPPAPRLSRAAIALLGQAAMAIERADLAREVEDAKVRVRADELREVLVNSVSHDLKTPLTSIIGAATALGDYWPRYDEATRRDLVATIREEAVRLGRTVGNALDLARFRNAMTPQHEPTDLADIVNAAVAEAQRAAPERVFEVRVPGDLPLLELDPFLAERALLQILDNAVKYSPAGTPITVIAQHRPDEIVVEVADLGVGFEPDEAPHVFDRFYRASGGDAQIAGTGLGLAIARAFVEADGGAVTADSAGRGAGARFRVAYPIPSIELERGAA
jgi:two-component system, OmpR family, sensor histidine kinase KdpD